jgi:hypothetical protein
MDPIESPPHPAQKTNNSPIPRIANASFVGAHRRVNRLAQS